MQDIFLKSARDNLTTYDLVVAWDICMSDGTTRMVYDSLRPELVNHQMEYKVMVNWVAENFILEDDRNAFYATFEFENLKSFKEDKYFFARTRFPDGRIRKFACLLSPTVLNGTKHIYFSVFDLENDIESIINNEVNIVPVFAESVHSFRNMVNDFMPFGLSVVAMLTITVLGVLHITPHIVSVTGMLLVSIIIIYKAYELCRYVIAKKNDGLENLNDVIVKSAKNLSKVISAEETVNYSCARYMACVSQELRTPMNSVVGMTVLANKKIDDKEYVLDCLGKIAKENTAMVEIIDNIVAITEAKSQKMSLNNSMFSLQELVTDFLDGIAVDVFDKDIDFNIRTQNIRREYLIGDEEKLKNIFRQLATNAIKYSPQGGRVTIDIREEFIQGILNTTRLVFVIKDNGYGISEEYQKEMYLAFSRSKDKRVKKIKGTGLGLALTKHLVDLMGGTIECESQTNAGTQFTVSIDLPVAGRDSNDIMMEPTKMLFIDDDKGSLDSSVKNFNEMGVTVDTVESAQKALGVLKGKCDYSIIAIDYNIEKEATYEFIKEVRACVGKDVTILLKGPFEPKHLPPKLLEVSDGFVQKPCFKSQMFIDLLKYNLGSNDSKSEVKTEKETIKLEGMNILIAEDNDLNWEIMSEILETVGVTSVRAENGLECVDKLFSSKDNEFDVILMDIFMPVMNGIVATEEIRKSQRDYVRTIPIIAMTADSFAETDEECRAAGMNGYVTKPVDLDKLFVEISRLKSK